MKQRRLIRELMAQLLLFGDCCRESVTEPLLQMVVFRLRIITDRNCQKCLYCIHVDFATHIAPQHFFDEYRKQHLSKRLVR